jgi:hypothetical protein
MNQEYLWLYPIIIGSLAFLIGMLLFVIDTRRKSKLEQDKLENKDLKLKNPKSIEPPKAKYVMEFLDDLIKKKYEYYLYKDILPVYIGNEYSKKEKFSKEKFLEIKNFFFNDLYMSLSPEMKKEMVTIFSTSGIEMYIHQRFATYFNKTDAKFLNKEEDIKDNMFFMSEIETNKN